VTVRFEITGNAVDVASRESLNLKFQLQRDLFGVVQLRRGFDLYAYILVFGAGIRRLADGGIGNEAGGAFDQRDLTGCVRNIVRDDDVRKGAVAEIAREDSVGTCAGSGFNRAGEEAAAEIGENGDGPDRRIGHCDAARRGLGEVGNHHPAGSGVGGQGRLRCRDESAVTVSEIDGEANCPAGSRWRAPGRCCRQGSPTR